MNCFSKKSRRTAPINDSSGKVVVPSKLVKMNGWSWPPRAPQVIGWLMYSYLAIVSFGIFIPLLPPPWHHVVYALMGTAFILHFITHIAAATIDPANDSLRAKPNYPNPLPLFDRSKQSQANQNLRCTLCDIKVVPKLKHCNVCNKCIKDFDHHCKWLDTCVGGRNYRCFFVALSSATFGTVLVAVVSLFIVIQYYLDPNNLRTAPQFESVMGNGTWLVFLPVAPTTVSSAGLLTIAFITIFLSIIILLPLGYLLGLHLYLFHRGWSMYEYVKMQRQREATKPNDAKKQAKKKKKPPETKQTSVNCEPTSPDTSGASKYDNKGPLTSQHSDSRRTELKTLRSQQERRIVSVMSKKTAENAGNLSANTQKLET